MGKTKIDVAGSRAADLRRQAEATLAQRLPSLKFGEPEVQRLLHELQVHQIELEMQNEALRQSQAETQAALERYVELNAHLEQEVEARTTALLLAETRATHILESSADGLYGVDAHGLITFINPAACNLLGCISEQAIGQSAHQLFHHHKADGSPYPVEECPTHSALWQGREVRIDDEVYWHADGHMVPVMFAAHPMVQNGIVSGSVISFVDMSEQRAAIEAKEKALAAAENLARLRSEFLANISHEMRTPLNGMLGFAEIGARNYQDSEKARHAFEQISLSGLRLLGVVNDVLDFSKIEAGRLTIEAIDTSLTKIIQQAVALIHDHVKAKHLGLFVKLSPDMPSTFRGDPLRIVQVLLNLLSNAVKFTGKGSITLSAFHEGGQLVFRVADTGIGMTQEQLAQLFQPFRQADGSSTREFGGTGLGLAIAKRIVELMDGKLAVESQPGVGSTFTFRLPCLAADPQAVAPSCE